MSIRRRVVGCLVSGAVSTTVFMAAGAPAQAAGGYYTFTNFGSGMCAGLDPAHFFDNGARVVQQPCNGQPEQNWAPVAVGDDHHQWVNQRSGKCMDVTDGVNADGTPVQQWDCTRTNGMYWKVTGGIPAPVPTSVVSRIGGRCLDVAGGSTTAGARIQIYHCTVPNAAQAWTVRP
ncbi:RICIN domain-containing protein [Streptomyces apricus]|nr:RICIN domain-containing protein [Streptomyces apricus]